MWLLARALFLIADGVLLAVSSHGTENELGLILSKGAPSHHEDPTLTSSSNLTPT